jgi:two-component system nitrogen regulation response regulator NtrX
MDAGHIEMDDSAIGFLMSRNWPGNVRELKNLAERIVVMYGGDRIGAEELQNLVQKKTEIYENFSNSGHSEDIQNEQLENILKLRYSEAKNSFEKLYLEFQLMRNDGVISKTAEAIGIYPSNLHAKLRKYTIRTGR